MPKEIFDLQIPLNEGDRHILVCQHSSCRAQNSAAVFTAFHDADLPPNTTVYTTHCQGQCSIAATVRIVPDETWYCRVTLEDVPAICAALHANTVVPEKLNPRIHRHW